MIQETPFNKSYAFLISTLMIHLGNIHNKNPRFYRPCIKHTVILNLPSTFIETLITARFHLITVRLIVRTLVTVRCTSLPSNKQTIKITEFFINKKHLPPCLTYPLFLSFSFLLLRLSLSSVHTLISLSSPTFPSSLSSHKFPSSLSSLI